MKKLFSIMLAVVMLALCLTACGDSSSTADSEKTESSSSAETTTTTAENKTEATTTTKKETKSTADPNGYAQKLVGVWKYEKVIRDSFSDKDAKHQGNIILTDNGKWIDWGYYVYADSQTIHHYGPNVYDYKIENNMLDNQYIVEMTDKKFALNDTDSHINAQEYIKSDLGKTTIDEAMKITDAYQCAYAIKSAIIKTENVKTYPDSKGVVPVSSLENSNDPIEKSIYWSVKEYAKNHGKDESNLGYVYYNSSWFKMVKEADEGSEMRPEYMFIQWSETKEGSPVGECCDPYAGFKDFESSKNVKLGEMPKIFSSFKTLTSSNEIYA